MRHSDRNKRSFVSPYLRPPAAYTPNLHTDNKVPTIQVSPDVAWSSQSQAWMPIMSVGVNHTIIRCQTNDNLSDLNGHSENAYLPMEMSSSGSLHIDVSRAS